MAEPKIARKLAVIVHADIAGSTALVQRDETLAHQRFNAAFQSFSKIIQSYGGAVHEIRGDALVAEFARASDAVCAALKFQQSNSEHNAGLSDDLAPVIRIGIALGEEVFAHETVTGAGVVLAQRVEQLAVPGGVCVTGAIHEAIPKRMPFNQESLGEQQIKGFDEPIRVYRVALRSGDSVPEGESFRAPRIRVTTLQMVAALGVMAVMLVGGSLYWLKPWAPDVEPASQDRMALELPEEPSIAVLPFTNMTGDPGQDFFVDGTTESLITALARVPNLFVIARNSTYTYKNKPVKVQEVAEQLGVRYVLEGGVQRSGDRVRISAQLIDALSGRHLWAESYDRKLEDLFKLQDDITKNVVHAMELKLGEVALSSAREGSTDNLEAYEHWLRGIELLRQNTKSSRTQAFEHLERAVTLDPNFVNALIALARNHHAMGRFGWSEDPKASYNKAEAISERVLTLDEMNSDIHALLASQRLLQHRHEEAIALCDKALALGKSADVLAECANTLNYLGKPDQALKLVNRAMRLNPHYPHWFLFVRGNAHRLMRQYDEALAAFEGWRVRSPDSPWPYNALAYTYAEMGRIDEAKAAVAELLKRNPEFSLKQQAKQTPYRDAVELERTLDGLRKAGLPEHPPLRKPEKPSIAVLPFKDLSGDPEQEYFADGMTEDLITELSKVSALRVVSRNSVFLYKGKSITVQQMAKELGVGHVLEGSVRRSGDQLRINAQLTDAISGTSVWAERYDEPLSDVFGLQDKLTRRIVAAMKVELTPREQDFAAGRRTKDIAAYDAYLRGVAHFNKRTPEDAVKAVGFFQQALDLDPNYHSAHAALAKLYWENSDNEEFNAVVDPGVGASYPPSGFSTYLNAWRLLQKARSEPSSEVHALSARMLQRQRRFDEAMEEAEKAIAIGPNNAAAHDALIENLIYAGKAEDALKLIGEFMHLEPNLPGEKLFLQGMAFYVLGKLEEAAASLEKARGHDPQQTRYAAIHAAVLAELGRPRHAEVALKSYVSIWEEADLNWAMFQWPFQKKEILERLAGAFIKAGMKLPQKRYYLATTRDRLTSEEIRTLLSNNTMKGKNRGYFGVVNRSFFGIPDNEFVVSRDEAGRIIKQGDLNYFRTNGTTQIKDNLLCDHWLDFLGEYCVAVYRNPLGTKDTLDEYLFFTLMSTFSFSVYDAAS